MFYTCCRNVRTANPICIFNIIRRCTQLGELLLEGQAQCVGGLDLMNGQNYYLTH